MQSVNQAFENVKNFETGMLCEPWTYGNYAFHIANNVDYTVTPENGKMVIAQGCTPISAARRTRVKPPSFKTSPFPSVTQ